MKNPEISPKPFSNVVNDFVILSSFLWGQGIVQKDCHDPENKTFFADIFSASGFPIVFKWSTEMWWIAFAAKDQIKNSNLAVSASEKWPLTTKKLRKNPSILIRKTQWKTAISGLCLKYTFNLQVLESHYCSIFPKGQGRQLAQESPVASRGSLSHDVNVPFYIQNHCVFLPMRFARTCDTMCCVWFSF